MATAVAEKEAPMGFVDQVKSFRPSFWFANAIEMFERWAYYGVRAVLSLYMVDAVANGGLEFTHVQKGAIYTLWAIIQSLLPMFTGGFADRYGYKKTIAVSMSVSMIGYLLMATQKTYPGFFFACMMLAVGTAIFKPGVQGTLVNSTNEKNSSLGWGFFYMLVNIGGFIGPATAGLLRVHGWQYVFFASIAFLAVNYLLLLCYKDIPIEQQEKVEYASRLEAFQAGAKEFFTIIGTSIKNVFEPRLITFLLIFSGFWLMFMQLFDILPNFIDDWVNSAPVLSWVGQTFHIANFVTMGQAGQNIPPEWMINLDAGSIVLLMIPIAWICGKLKPIVSMIIGMTISSFGLILAGSTMNGAFCLAGILIFAIGEMASSPKMSEYLGLIAPPGKKGLYMGYANVPLAFGWGIGSTLGGYCYQNFADKITLAKAYMVNHLGMTSAQVSAIPKEQIMTTMAGKMNITVIEANRVLWNLNHPNQIWLWFAGIGLASVVGMTIYHFVIEHLNKKAQLATAE